MHQVPPGTAPRYTGVSSVVRGKRKLKVGVGAKSETKATKPQKKVSCEEASRKYRKGCQQHQLHPQVGDAALNKLLASEIASLPLDRIPESHMR